MIKRKRSSKKTQEFADKFEAGRGAIRLAVLGILLRDEQCGYQIAKQMRAADLNLDTNYGVLYPLLARMEHDRLIQGHWEKGRGQVGLYVYKITPAGKKALQRSEKTWLRMIQHIKRLIHA